MRLTLERFEVRENGDKFGTLNVHGFVFFTQEKQPALESGTYDVALDGALYSDTTGKWRIGTHILLGRGLGLVDNPDGEGKILAVSGAHSAERKFHNMLDGASFILNIKDPVPDAA